MDANRPIGDWDAELREFSITEDAQGVLVRFPEAPGGYEGRLVDAGGGRWRMEGGPFPGVELVPEESGSWSLGGYVPLTPLARPAQPPPGSGLTAPSLELDPDEKEQFLRLWARVDHPANVWEVDLAGRAPHRFIQWLTDSELVIFHGSNDLDLDRLRPVRNSRELYDSGQRGNLEAVYGTHDGLWSMFFAVVDRSRLEGSIRNGVDRFHSHIGDHLDLYHFSIPKEMLGRRPFRSGAVYLLPRDSFECLPLYPGGPPSAEWACRREIRPMARIRVVPEDFPFLNQIGGHAGP